MRTFFVTFAAGLALGAPTAMAHGDLHEAIDAVSVIIASSPNDATLLLRRAELERQHGDLAAAEADYTRARRLRPDFDVVTYGLAQIRLARGEEHDGMKLLNEYLAKIPGHAEARAQRAKILEKRGDWKRADADLAAAVASSPEPHFATQRAELLERHGQPVAAARCLDDASRARGRVPVLEHRALEIEVRAGLTEAALRRADALIAREPRADIWLARKAQLLGRAGRAAEAHEAWDQAAAAFARVPPGKRGSELNRKLAAEIEAGRAGAPRQLR